MKMLLEKKMYKNFALASFILLGSLKVYTEHQYVQVSLERNFITILLCFIKVYSVYLYIKYTVHLNLHSGTFKCKCILVYF